MNAAALTNATTSVIVASTPLLLAATGELVVETSGVLNLGVEGMMLVGAIAGFATALATGSPTLGAGAAFVAGACFSLLFALVTLTFVAAQVPAGLALAIFGGGLSTLAGSAYTGLATTRLPHLHLPGISDLPFVGPVVFGQDLLVYASFAMAAGVALVLSRTRLGLVVRAIGDSHDAGHALGYPVIAIRYATVAFGGGMAGLAGGDMSLAYNASWSENLTAGRGWIALALVVFASWRPGRLVLGAYLFGGIMYLSFFLQGLGMPIPAPFMSALPYCATIVTLVLISADKQRIRRNAAACLGRPFHPAS